MAELNYKADLNDTNENQFDPVPAGEYPVVITDSDLCPTKAGTGHYLKLTYEIIDGPMKGKKLFENLNINNPSKQAVAIAQRALNALCSAVDMVEVDDSAQLHNIPLKLDVGIKNSDEYGPQNTIKKHLPLKGGAKKETPKEEKTEKSAGKKPPWEK